MERIQLLENWVKEQFPAKSLTIQPASVDASFRRYFRVSFADQTFIVMDAPPLHEDCTPFLRVAEILAATGVHVPKILAQNLEHGFLLLSDLGNTTFLQALNDQRDIANHLYGDAIDALIKMQLSQQAASLPDYDEALLLQEDSSRSAHLVLVNNPEHHPDGDFVLQNGLLVSEGAPCLTFSGMGIYRPELFHGIPRGEKAALAPLIRDRALAVDIGTGSGPLLEVLAPVFNHVVAVDRESVQLERARERLRARGYGNVSLVCEAYDSEAVRKLVLKRGGADAVFASRVLHHAPKPGAALVALAKLLKPEGALVVIDYASHENETMREEQADLWLGFSAEELTELAKRAGLAEVSVRPIPAARCGDGPDAGVSWQCLVARRG